jgi:hypothetical protein
VPIQTTRILYRLLISALILLSLLWLVLAEWPAEARGEPTARGDVPMTHVLAKEIAFGRCLIRTKGCGLL